MSDQNVELHRRLNAAFAALNVDALLEICDPQLEFETRFAPLGGVPVYRGHEGMRAFMHDMQEVWGADIGFGVEEFFDFGERTLALYELRARVPQSRTQVTMPATVLATWRDGLCTHWKSYVDRTQALGDLEVSAEELNERRCE
jgi:ketosteroid isomerase-like protein